MDCQTTQSSVLCSNGYYGFQPLLNGNSGACEQVLSLSSNGHTAGSLGAWGDVAVSPPGWQRKRNREEAAVYGNGDAAAYNALATEHQNGTAAKRLCSDLYQEKLQQAMAIGYDVGITASAQGMSVQNGTDSSSIGTDSSMMVGDECSGMEVSSCPMSTDINDVEAVHTSNGVHNSDSLSNVATIRASQTLPPHTCCTSRAQLCTMSFQQSYILSSSKECSRCLAGEPAPYLSIQQTVENLSKLY